MSDPQFTRQDYRDSDKRRLDYLKLHECVVIGVPTLSAVVAEVCKWSQWFEVLPLPDDRYVISVKHENASRLDELILERQP